MNKIRSHAKDLKSGDLDDSIKSLPPGEWVELRAPGSEQAWVGFVNPLIQEKYSCVHVLRPLVPGRKEVFEPSEYVEAQLREAWERRKFFRGYAEGSRLFYGTSDGLPGLIIDLFTNAAVIQINTAGVDRYREAIKGMVETLTGVAAFFLDNPKYREKEFLPTYENPPLPGLVVRENGLEYRLRAEVIQKVGFYYDHRENRLQLRQLLGRLAQAPAWGLDLFSYTGAWGMNALAGGAGHLDFVDQGDFAEEVAAGLAGAGFAGKGEFHRQDVFKFLDVAQGEGRKWDLILCDPPAFAKSALQKPQALEGYSRLHRKVLKLSQAGSILAFSSCTHYVGHDEFQKNVLDAAQKEGRRLQLLHCGIQGWDHPVASLEDRANYIKCYFYRVE